MKRLLTTFCFFVFMVKLCLTCVYAETLMSLYQTALQHFPTIESFNYIEQSLQNENKGLGWQKLFNIDVASNYSHFSTVDLGKYYNGELSIYNTFDIFNKNGLERAINRYEIQKNKSLTDAEKKNIFTTVNEAYFNIIKYSHLLKIHEESLKWIEDNILLVNQGVENGLFPAMEINRWNIEKLNRQNSVISDKLDVSRSEETLRLLTGLEKVTPELIDHAEYAEVSVENLLENSPELAIFNMEIMQLELEIRKENRSIFPDLEVGNSLVENNEPGSTGDQHVVSANLNFKLFDGGKRYRINANRARIKSMESSQKAARTQFTEFYRNKILEIDTQKDMLKNLESARDLSSDNLNKLVVGYNIRFVNFTTLFDAFRDDVALQEDCETTYAEFNKNYQYLYHLSRGDIYF